MSTAAITEPYYRRTGTGYLATESTAGYWTPGAQAGAPPIMLTTSCLEKLGTTIGTGRLARLTFDFLKPIPVGLLHIGTEVARAGRSMALLEAKVFHADHLVARASAWWMASANTTTLVTNRFRPLPEGTTTGEAFWRDVPGQPSTLATRVQEDLNGDNVMWLSPLVTLVDQEPPSPLAALCGIADMLNGVGMVTDHERIAAINVDLSIHIHRQPHSTEIGVRGKTSIGPDGIGVASGSLYDPKGFIATVAMALLIRERG